MQLLCSKRVAISRNSDSAARAMQKYWVIPEYFHVHGCDIMTLCFITHASCKLLIQGLSNFNPWRSQRLLTCCPATAKPCDVISPVSISKRNPYRSPRQRKGIPWQR